jgi:hypothetical protein
VSSLLVLVFVSVVVAFVAVALDIIIIIWMVTGNGLVKMVSARAIDIMDVLFCCCVCFKSS